MQERDYGQGLRMTRCVLVGALVVLAALGSRATRHPIRTAVRMPLSPVAADEERVDSATLAELSWMDEVRHDGAHEIIAIVDPTKPDALEQVKAIDSISKQTRLGVSGSVFFAPEARIDENLAQLLLALECARLGGHLSDALELFDWNRKGLTALPAPMKSRLTVQEDEAIADCIRLRDTQERVSNAIWLGAKLHLRKRPAFVVDSFIVRGPVTMDSLTSRINHRR